MKILKKKNVFSFLMAFLAFLGCFGLITPTAYAEGESAYQYGLTVTPMKEKIILNPGETYLGSFTIAGPAKNTNVFEYKIGVSPFFANEKYEITYEETGDHNQITNWVKLGDTGGTLDPNQTKTIHYKINVPNDAPAGGQYLAIIVQSKEASADGKTAIQLNQSVGIAHTIFAEVAGSTIHSGKIISTGLSAFMLDGKITGTATIENTGNVHSDATYTLQVFPLFSGEEVYTNEEDPETATILPSRTLYHESSWKDTPPVGIFNVTYTVKYNDLTEQISRLVIICPLWLIFIILFVIIGIVVWLVFRVKARKQSAKVEE